MKSVDYPGVAILLLLLLTPQPGPRYQPRPAAPASGRRKTYIADNQLKAIDVAPCLETAGLISRCVFGLRPYNR